MGQPNGSAHLVCKMGQAGPIFFSPVPFGSVKKGPKVDWSKNRSGRLARFLFSFSNKIIIFLIFYSYFDGPIHFWPVGPHDPPLNGPR